MEFTSVMRGYAFESLCEKIFDFYNIEYVREVRNRGAWSILDFLITDHNGDKYVVECKFYSSAKFGISNARKVMAHLDSFANEDKSIKGKILMIGSTVTQSARDIIESNDDFLLIDIENLMYLVSENEILNHELLELMSGTLYEVSEVDPHSPNRFNHLFANHKTVSKSDRSESVAKDYITRLESIKPGHEEYRKHEELCEEILKYLFRENLIGWIAQNRTEDELNRMDLVCRIKEGHEFWNFIINGFQSRYLIFEFKNYNSLVKQTQIYTTEKYLFKTALRTVCILITRKGIDNHAKQAITGILRENGKLIIPLSDQCLVEMITSKESGGIPEDVLFRNVDNMLLTLSK